MQRIDRNDIVEIEGALDQVGQLRALPCPDWPRIRIFMFQVFAQVRDARDAWYWFMEPGQEEAFERRSAKDDEVRAQRRR